MSQTRPLWKRLRKHVGLIPLYLITATGFCGACAYGVRSALYNPDVKWDRYKPEISNEEYKQKQYNFYSPTIDYSRLKSPAPNYEETN